MRGFIRGTVTGGTFNRNATCTGPECGFTDVFLTTFGTFLNEEFRGDIADA